MASVKIFFDKKRKDKNGECTVYAIVHMDYKSTKINTGIKAEPGTWNSAKNKINGTSKSVRDKNLIIAKTISNINDIFIKYRLANKKLTPVRLKAELENPNENMDAYEVFEKIMKKKRKDSSPSTVEYYETGIKWLKKFKSEIVCSELTVEFFEEYYGWLKGTKRHANGIAQEIKKMSVLINEAIKAGYMDKNPIKEMKIKKVASHVEFLSVKELEKIQNFYEKGKGRKSLIAGARHFLFMCYTGLRVSDLQKLTHENLLNDFTLRFVPAKTKNSKPAPLELPLNKYARQLIKDENCQTGYLFDTPTYETILERSKNLVKHLGINKKVTPHVARHTFATTFLEKTNDVVTLQRLLGHSDIQTTMRYVHLTQDTIIKRMKQYESTLFDRAS